jgi:mannose-1-phosphate guanylyltransferase
MRALLLAAGRGERLRPITNTIPKCMVKISDRPLLGWWLDALERANINDVLINLHYLPKAVESYVKNSKYKSNVSLIHEEILLGTAGTVIKNASFFGGEDGMVIHADNFCLANLSSFVDAHFKRPKNCEITLMTFDTDNPSTCGMLELDQEGRVKNLHEKPAFSTSKLANGAVYIVSPKAIEEILKLNPWPSDFSTDILPLFIGRIFTHHNNVYHRDIGNALSLAIAEEYAANNLRA